MVFGWGSESGSKQKTDASSAPTREERQKCWDARDAYFACLDDNKIVVPGDGPGGDAQGVCADFRKAYESRCGKSWIDYFNKRRILEVRQAKTLEAAAAQGAGRAMSK